MCRNTNNNTNNKIEEIESDQNLSTRRTSTTKTNNTPSFFSYMVRPCSNFAFHIVCAPSISLLHVNDFSSVAIHWLERRGKIAPRPCCARNSEAKSSIK